MHISYFTRKILLDYEDGQYSTPMIAINRSLIKYRKMNRMSKEVGEIGAVLPIEGDVKCLRNSGANSALTSQFHVE